jgi:hypothetical protein
MIALFGCQEETSRDAKRRVQQFIKRTIEMQNDDRFNIRCQEYLEIRKKLVISRYIFRK